MFICLIFVRVFVDESLGGTSFRSLQVFVKILSSELNIFPYFILFYYYYARCNSISEHYDAMQL